jgi:alginate O-acetyltransferase complex protein AlgI
MVFNSLSYFLFLPIVFLAHHFSPDRFRRLVLLIASFAFYAALGAPHLIFALLLATGIAYVGGLWLHSCSDEKTGRCILWGCITTNVLLLMCLKYLPFCTENLNSLLRLVTPGITIPVSKAVVAVGVSYFVFQGISYLVDIYLEKIEPERHAGNFALYLSFFPKLLQGPIERADELLPQLKQSYTFNYDNARSGMVLFAWGLFKKVVVADRMAMLVDPVYNHIQGQSAVTLLIATYLFAFQLYFDFSGYTDMARGTARAFNIELTRNFNSPYLARSVADFWRRWHMSFSRWILDYLFKPLQLSLRHWKDLGTACALLSTFLISGLWHGASWSFVIWGMLHGTYLATANFYRPFQKRIYARLGLTGSPLVAVWQTFVTFQLVAFSWIFFRANSLDDALAVARSLLTGFETLAAPLATARDIMHVLAPTGNLPDTAMLAASFCAAISLPIIAKRHNLFEQPPWLRWPAYLTLLAWTTLFAAENSAAFLYTKF